MDPGVAERLRGLVASWPGGPWSWDGRFQMVASSFGRELEPTARTSAMHAFPRGWTAKSLDTAPAELRALAERSGGLRAGQRLLAGADDGLYGLWWPWSGGETITLRIGFVVGAVEELRALFGVS